MGKRKRRKKNFSNKICPKIFTLHFLENQDMVDIINKQFCVMFILRGLPGSGKSTLVEHISGTYPNAVICSADHFLMEDGKYVWTLERRTFAHRYCSELASRSCEMKCPVVVIDNTNIRSSEVKVYIDIAFKNNYVTILVTPQTSWKFDPVQLEKHCIHGIPQKSLKHKCKLYQDIQPVFYGWFIGQLDAKILQKMALDYFHLCLEKIPELNIQISKEQKNDTKEDYNSVNYFNPVKSGLIYCIAKNLFKGKLHDSFEFHGRELVQESCGKVFCLDISGILITPHVLSARVDLSADQLAIYSQSEYEDSTRKEQIPFKTVCGKQRENKSESLPEETECDLVERMAKVPLETVEEKLSVALSKITPGIGFIQTEKCPQSDTQCPSSQGDKDNVLDTYVEEPNKDDYADYSSGSQDMGKEVEKETNMTTIKKTIKNKGKGISLNPTEENTKMEAKFVSDLKCKETNEKTKKEPEDIGNNLREINVNKNTRIDEKVIGEKIPVGENNSGCKNTGSLEKDSKSAYILLASHDKNIDPNTINEEMIKVTNIEESEEFKSFLKFSTADVDIYHLSNGTCMLYLKQNIFVNALYTGQY